MFPLSLPLLDLLVAQSSSTGSLFHAKQHTEQSTSASPVVDQENSLSTSPSHSKASVCLPEFIPILTFECKNQGALSQIHFYASRMNVLCQVSDVAYKKAVTSAIYIYSWLVNYRVIYIGLNF